MLVSSPPHLQEVAAVLGLQKLADLLVSPPELLQIFLQRLHVAFGPPDNSSLIGLEPRSHLKHTGTPDLPHPNILLL